MNGLTIRESSDIHRKFVSVIDPRTVPLTDEDIAIVVRIVFRSTYGTAQRILRAMKQDRIDADLIASYMYRSVRVTRVHGCAS
jgi:hypothetical protein